MRTILLYSLSLLVATWTSSQVAAQTKNTQTASKKAPPPKKADDAGWTSMFDGKSLNGWKIAKDIDYEQSGKVLAKDKWLILEAGQPGTGIHWAKDFPKLDYEVKLEASRLDGGDFFCGMTFPVRNEYVTLILGGWGGSVVGLSNIDGYSAVENETTQGCDFKNKQWYRVHLRVTKDKIQVWLDDEKSIDFETKERKLSIRWEVEACRPFGFATWQTTGGLRNIRYRKLTANKSPTTKPN